MTITITPVEIGLLVEETARKFANNISAWPGDAADKYAARLRELLDLYDETVPRRTTTEPAAQLPQSGSGSAEHAL